jgi:hypothetical protein
MSDSRVKKNMEVIGADGVHIGTVARVENGKIKLTKVDSGEGHHKGHHHCIDAGLVADVEGERYAYQRTRQWRLPWRKSSLERSSEASSNNKVVRVPLLVTSAAKRIGLIPQAARPAVRTGRTSLLCLPGRGRCLRF